MKKQIRRILAGLLGIALLLGMPSPALAFKLPIHEEITREALGNFQVVAEGSTLKFTEKAIAQIVKENLATDDLPNQFNSEMHFDGEDFPGGSKRVMDLKEKTIDFVTNADPNPTAANTRLGKALHTIQDFYAHSNWVELGHSSPDINTEIGRKELPEADPDTHTCPNDPGTLGGEGLSQLTSGYFILSNNVACGVPEGKCRHGVPVVCSAGINKDDKSRTGFSTARALAVDATKDFLDQIFSDSRMDGNVKAIKLLMRIPN